MNSAIIKIIAAWLRENNFHVLLWSWIFRIFNAFNSFAGVFLEQ